jgi:uncharacterized membrane protein
VPTERWRQAKRPDVPRLQGAYGHPFHPMLVTVPLGTWTASLVFDVASHLGGPAAALATGSAWLIGIGLVAALAAAVAGYLDLRMVPTSSTAMRIGLVHMGLTLTSVTLYVSGLLLRWSQGTTGGGVPWGLIALSAVAYTLVAVGGRLGAKLSYRYGVRVADESAQLDGYGPRARQPVGPSRSAG